jgi:hypothetical protein
MLGLLGPLLRGIPVKQSDREALRRVIEYARSEAEEQRESFTAYLLELAMQSLTPRGEARVGQDLSRMQ